MSRAVFLDRDGVINRKAPEGAYITRLEDLHILPGAAEAINSLHRAGFTVIVVTNQRCVARGLMATSELDLLHQEMCRRLAVLGALIDGIYYCPHDTMPVCACRKPAPGMLFIAAGEHGIDLSKSWMIGDSDSDIEAGRSAGCRTAKLGTANSDGSGQAELYARSLFDAVRQILTRDDYAVEVRSTVNSMIPARHRSKQPGR